MAKGSEKFQWNLFPKETPHVCWSCDRKLVIEDVAEVRTVYPGRRYQFLCVTCRNEKVAEFVAKTRRAMGLKIIPPQEDV